MVKVDNKLGTWDSYTGFCHTHRFPNNLSDRVKRQIYFLASQTTWDWRSHVHKFIQHANLQEKSKAKFPDIVFWNHVKVNGHAKT